MNSRRGIRILALSFGAALLACAATAVSAQEIFKLVDAGGKITFSDRPEPTPQADAAQDPDIVHSQARVAGTSSRRVAAIVDANEADRRLREAQLKRKQGIAPLPGEQAKGARGGALNERYWRRQEKLRIAVEEAQRRQRATSQPQFAAR